MNYLCVNKSGQAYSVFNSDTGKRVGTIYDREVFVLTGMEGSQAAICILSSSGSLLHVPVDFAKQPYPIGMLNSIQAYPYGTEVINGTTYKTFKMRQRKNIYTGAGNYWGAVAANMLVATNDNIMGDTHVDWKKINYVKRSTDGAWIKVEGDGYSHGFVDTGLSSASTYSTIPFYGSW